MKIPSEPPWIVEVNGVKFAVPEPVCLLLKAVSEERDQLVRENAGPRQMNTERVLDGMVRKLRAEIMTHPEINGERLSWQTFKETMRGDTFREVEVETLTGQKVWIVVSVEARRERRG